jgi:hypothetical protein
MDLSFRHLALQAQQQPVVDVGRVDLRRPQDYFGRVWATAFCAEGLTRDIDDENVDDEYDTNEDQAEEMP